MTTKRFFNLVVFISVLFLLFSVGQADFLAESKSDDMSVNDYFNSIAYGNYVKAKQLNRPQFLLASEEIDRDIYGFTSKSTRKAFILSLVLPGAGEYYAESKIKAGVFLGLEALFWTGYLSYHGKATKKEDEYNNFADLHWSEDRFRDSILSIYEWDIYDSTIPTGITLRSDYDSVVIIEHLPDSKNQQYYEMIGKYDQFRYGWDDFDRVNFLTPHRNLYLNMRDDSNKLFDKARYSLIAIIGNHILSGFDAVWSVKRYNRKVDKFSQFNLKFRLVEYDQKPIPAVLLTYKF